MYWLFIALSQSIFKIREASPFQAELPFQAAYPFQAERHPCLPCDGTQTQIQAGAGAGLNLQYLQSRTCTTRSTACTLRRCSLLVGGDVAAGVVAVVRTSSCAGEGAGTFRVVAGPSWGQSRVVHSPEAVDRKDLLHRILGDVPVCRVSGDF